MGPDEGGRTGGGVPGPDRGGGVGRGDRGGGRCGPDGWGRVVISDVLGGKDVVEGRDGRTDGRSVLSIRYRT
jgi:hypothetical protein